MTSATAGTHAYRDWLVRVKQLGFRRKDMSIWTALSYFATNAEAEEAGVFDRSWADHDGELGRGAGPWGGEDD